MKILVACEYSRTVWNVFTALGHEVWSCDLLQANEPGPRHYVGDVMEIIGEGWDMMIAHPPCTYLTNSAAWCFKDDPGKEMKPGVLFGKERRDAREEALQFVAKLWNSGIPKICVENPQGCINTRLQFMPRPQVVHPYQFGHDASKGTCLWEKELPPLVIDPAQFVKPRMVCKVCKGTSSYDESQLAGCTHCGAGGGSYCHDGAIKQTAGKTGSRQAKTAGRFEATPSQESRKQWARLGVKSITEQGHDMSNEKESMARMQTQSKEFEAAAELAKRLRQLPPVVDGDYEEARHYYESALASFVEAMAVNGRFGRGNRYKLQAVAEQGQGAPRKLYRVRCCCTPRKVLGYIEGPDTGGTFQVQVRTHHLEQIEPYATRTEYTLQEVEVRKFRDWNREERAVYSDDKPLSFWRRVVGFEEAMDPAVNQQLAELALCAHRTPTVAVGHFVEHILGRGSFAYDERNRLDEYAGFIRGSGTDRPSRGIVQPGRICSEKESRYQLERLQNLPPLLSDAERDALRQQIEGTYTLQPGPTEAAMRRLAAAVRGFVDSVKASLCMELHLLRQVQVGEVEYVYCPKCDRAWSPDVDGWQQVEAGSDLLKDIERGSHEARGNVTQ